MAPHFKEDYMSVQHPSDTDSIEDAAPCDTETLLSRIPKGDKRYRYLLPILVGMSAALNIILAFGIFFLFRNPPQVAITDQQCARQLFIIGNCVTYRILQDMAEMTLARTWS